MPVLPWLSLMPITRRRAGPAGVWTCAVSPTPTPRWSASWRPSTATRSRARASSGVYQRPLVTRMSISGRSAVPHTTMSLPAALALVDSSGCIPLTPGIDAMTPFASSSNGRVATVPAKMS
jgi:hypothetical protein